VGGGKGKGVCQHEEQMSSLEVTHLLTVKHSLIYRPKDAVRALKKRIVGNRNFKEVMLALTVSVAPSSPSSSVCVYTLFEF